MRVLADEGDRLLGQRLEGGGDFLGFGLRPRGDRPLEEAAEVDLDVRARGLIDDRWELLLDVDDEVLEVALHPGADRRDLFADPGPALLDRARLPREILLEDVDAAAELFDRHHAGAAASVDALLQELRGLDPLPQRVVEEDAPALVGEELGEVREQVGHAARGGVAVEELLGRDGEDDRRLHELAQLGADVREGLPLLVPVPDVALRHHEDDLVARLAEQLLLQEDALALLQRLASVEQEEHRVRARDVAVGDVGALEREVVHAGGVDEDHALAQELGRITDLEVLDLGVRRGRRRRGDVVTNLVLGRLGLADREELHLFERERRAAARGEHDLGAGLGGVLEVVNHGRRRRHAHGEDRRAEERVHERRLAVVELAHHHEVKAIGLQLLHEIGAEARAQRLGADAVRDAEEVAQRRDHVSTSVVKGLEHGMFSLPP